MLINMCRRVQSPVSGLFLVSDMKGSCILLLVCLGSCLGYLGPEVVTYDGLIRGLHETTYGGRQINSFLGIPYAKPPAGKYRFHESVAPGPWIGVYNATQYGSDCLQYSQDTYKTNYPIIGSEDCLYINVHTPKLPVEGEAPPSMDVIVYIHGGAFMFKYGGEHGPRHLLDKDVVLVTFNYRVGPLGFMSTGDEVIPGNNGLKDQVLALKWIQMNIASFGGNPQSVILAGTSAGGASVHYHYLSPLSRGLFKAGISMSGTALNSWTQQDKARENTLKIAEELGCPTNDTRLVIKCLRKRPARQIVALTKMFMPWMYNPFSPFAPVVEIPVSHAFITESPIDIIKSGKAQNLPWMATFTSHEGLYPGAELVGDPKNLEELEQRWDELMPYVLDFYNTVPNERWAEVSQKVREQYMKGKQVTGAIPELIEMLGDRLFVADIVKAAELQATVNTAPVYTYKFTYRGKHSTSENMAQNDVDYGTSHADDTAYVFERFDMNTEETENDVAMMNKMVDLFTTFASTGQPSFGATEPWPAVKDHLPEFTYKDIVSVDSAPVVKGTDMGQQNFWNSLQFNENVPRDQAKRDEL